MCKNKKCAKYDKLYIFEKPFSLRIQTCKNICIVYKNYICIQGKLKILFKSICAKIYAKLFRTNYAICLLLFKAFQRAIKSGNPMTGSRSKCRFSRVQVK